MNANKKKTIVIEADQRTVAWGSVRVTFNERGGIDVYGNAPVTVHPAANDDVSRLDLTAEEPAKAEPRIGEVMEDGTVYAGISSTTGTRMFAYPGDAPACLTWHDAARYAFNLEAHGHKGSWQQTERNLKDAREDDGGWRLPTRAELKQLHRHKHAGALKGTFRNGVGGSVAHWYWSCTEHPNHSSDVCGVRFTAGDVGWFRKDDLSLSSRPVRAEPRP